MKLDVLIIGYGSIGKRHAQILEKRKDISKIYVVTKQKLKNFITLKSISEVSSINPDYIIIANNTSKHLATLKNIERLFSNKFVLIEKPLFHKYENFKIKNNKYFVGYNLRLHPIIKKIKQLINKKKIFLVNVRCESYLPLWRDNRSYSLSSSAKVDSGGGVLLDLSHELDYSMYLFGKIRVKSVFNSKISNLKINTDDILILLGTIGDKKSNSLIDIKLSYFSKIPKREIFIYGDNFTINANLIDNSIIYRTNSKSKKIKFDKMSLMKTYSDQHDFIIKKKFNNLCSYAEGMKVMKLIKEIKEKNIL
tara:strand:+ start:2811 stop:3734 length:924 start_codon:yes stop_codon:yes gene_type:complete